jgi:hypothetical protein
MRRVTITLPVIYLTDFYKDQMENSVAKVCFLNFETQPKCLWILGGLYVYLCYPELEKLKVRENVKKKKKAGKTLLKTHASKGSHY